MASTASSDSDTSSEWGGAMEASVSEDAETATTTGEAWAGTPPWDQVADPVAVFGLKGSRSEVQKASFDALLGRLATEGDSDSRLRARQQINGWLEGRFTTAELLASAEGGINGTKGTGIVAQRRADAFVPGEGADFFEFLVNCWANYQAACNNVPLGGLETSIRHGGRHGGLGVNHLLDQKYLACIRQRAAAEGIALHIEGEDGFYSLNIGQFSEVPLGEYLRVIEYGTGFGKILSIVGTIASFFPGVGQAIGAFVHGVAAIASGGSLIDGLKAGLGAYLSAGGLGGGAVERLAGAVLQSDGDPLVIGVALLNVGLEGTALQDALDAHHIRITPDGLSIAPNGGSLRINLSADGGVGLAFSIHPDLTVTLDDDGGLGLEVTVGDTTVEAATDGTITARHDFGGLFGDGTRTSIGVSGNVNDGGLSLTGGQVDVTNPDGFVTTTDGTIDLQTGDSSLHVGNNAEVLDVIDQLDELFGDDDRTGDYTAPKPNIEVSDPEVTEPAVEEPELGELDTPGPDIDYTPPETAGLYPLTSDLLEEIVVYGQYVDPLAHVVDTPSHTPAGNTHEDPATTPTGVDPAESGKVMAAAISLINAAGEMADVETGLGLTDSVLGLRQAMADFEADPSLEHYLRLQKAVMDVFVEAAEQMREPAAKAFKVIAKRFGVGLDYATALDPNKPLEERFDALMRLATMTHPAARAAVEVYIAARDFGSALFKLANADIARDPSTGRTSLESLFGVADELKDELEAVGDWVADSSSKLGDVAESILVDDLGIESAGGISESFDRMGEAGEVTMDAIADAGARLAVIWGALPATLIGAGRGLTNSIQPPDGGP